MYAEAAPDLIEHARHDRAAFGEIYDIYVRRVYAYCLSHSKDPAEAEDLTSHTFERALGAISRYQDRGAPFSAWLLRIAANLLTDRGRRSGRIVYIGDNPLPEPGADRPHEPGPEELVEQWERAGLLRERMATLPEDQRRALQLRFWHGLAVAEVAERMDRNENATKQLLHRAIRNLRSRLGDEVPADV
jgi:RNA polymerase sigma-70 factor (ECF subfamily)